MNKIVTATLALFNAVPILKKEKTNGNKSLLERTAQKGFIFAPEVIFNYSKTELTELIDLIGITSEQMNNSFHKSWKKIKEADIEQLVLEQIVHYVTTYGFEEFGIYDASSVYMPQEKLKIPNIDIEGIKLTIIKGYTKKEFKEKLLNLLNSGIALSEETINNVVEIAFFFKLTETEIKNIKNKEVRISLYTYLNLIPGDPIEFLRFVVYRATDSTLLIKNKDTIEKIKSKKNLDVLNLFIQYKHKYGLIRLSEIFYRFKPLFLAFKGNIGLNTIINRIRKLAYNFHKPMQEDYLNSITAKIKKDEKVDYFRLEKELNKVNIFRKIRLAYALKFRTKDSKAILYRIRNGKGYSKEFNFANKKEAGNILDYVLDSITDDINVENKKIYIPDYIKYTLPATEKQFIGNFPSGTYIKITKDMIIGVHWENTKNYWVDLDLSMISSEVGKIGWNSQYRTEDKSILFSGDMTTAELPLGASELFYIQKQLKSFFIVLLNFFNMQNYQTCSLDKNTEIPFKIIVAKEKVKEDFNENYMINPNNLVVSVDSKINQKQKILGLLVTTTKENKFYFVETSVGNTISSSSKSKVTNNSKQYLSDFYTNTIKLNDILLNAGAILVNNKKECDIDLSPENLEKDSILNLLKLNKKEK